MPESPRFVPPDADHEARRDEFGPDLMRRLSDIPVAGEKLESLLRKRSEWVVKSSHIQEYLAEKIQWREPGNKLAGAEKGVSVLCIGAGKGHEMDEIDAVLPKSEVTGLDPHDYLTKPAKKRLETLAHDARYLPKTETAENLASIPDASQDGATLFFVLHHIDEKGYKKIFAQLRRVLKEDGQVFIAEDIVDTEEERKVTEREDKIVNVEFLHSGPHTYKNIPDWKEFFLGEGFETVEAEEQKPGKVRHGFFVLKKRPQRAH